MKRFLLMICFLSAAITGLFISANISISTSSAAAYQAQTNHTSSAPYYYLENPKMLTADTNGNTYLINESSTNNHELIVLRDSTVTKRYTITETPKFIKHAGSYVFVFTSPSPTSASVYVYDLSTLPNTTSLTHKYIISLPANDPPLNTLEFFDAYYANNTYSLFYANTTHFGWREYTITSSTYSVKRTQHPNTLDGNLRIGAITSDGAGSIYLAAPEPYSDPGYDIYYIYHANGAKFNRKYLANITSLTYIPSTQHFAAVSDQTLTLFCEDSSKSIPTNKESTFYTNESKSPLFVTTTSNKLLTIDSLKKSIDEYDIGSHEIKFNRIIVGHRGQDSGFYNVPQALTVIGKNEYIITDISGQVKLVKEEITKDFITSEHATLKVTAMCFDNWNSVYMYDNNPGYKNIMQYNLKGELIKKIPTTLNVIQLVSDPHQNIYVIATTGIYMINGNAISTVSLETIETSDRAIYSEQSNTLHFAPASALDVAIDALGNPIYLSKVGSSYYVSGTSFNQKIESASVAESNPSLNFDRLNNKLYYIGAHHAIETAILDLWTFLDYPQPSQYKSTASALRNDDEAKFLKTTKKTLIYEYPNGINSLAKIAKGSILKTLSLQPEIDGISFNYHQVIYENSKTGEYCIGFVSHHATENSLPYTTDFGFVDKNLTSSARIIFNNTIIYKYATTNQNISLGTLSKNYDNSQVMSVRGVKLNNKVTSLDSFGLTFYEIRISWDAGKSTYIPDPNGDFVGYLNSNSVIDYHLPPSDKKFIANASLVFPRTLTNGLPVYTQEKGIFVHNNSEYLKNNQEIRIVGTYNKNQKYTFITYFDSELGLQRDGWVETKYVVLYVISNLQLAALIILIVILLGVLTLFIIRARYKKKKSTTNEMNS